MNSRVSEFVFKKTALFQLESRAKGKNWPVVYILENRKEAYVGESTSAVKRMKDHLEDKRREIFKKFFLIEDETFNKSATLDIESKLIEYIAADGKYSLQNNNRGMRNHDYYQKGDYEKIFKEIWEELRQLNITSKSIPEIQNSDLFKFSPYKTLTEDQAEIVEEMDRIFVHQEESINIVSGEPGSGKTILAIYLVKYLISSMDRQPLRIGLVLPQTSLRKTVKKIFKQVEGLKVNMVIGPNDVLKEEGRYDVLIVDEAHRLTRRRNLPNYATFDAACQQLGLNPHKSSQLDWIKNKGRHIVLLYDQNQTVKPSDVDKNAFESLNEIANHFFLKSQQRVLAGDKYPAYIERVFKSQQSYPIKFNNYEFFLYRKLEGLISTIQSLDSKYGLCRIVAGYAWDWKSKDDPQEYDIQIENVNLRWNSVTEDWINSKNAVNEIGCIHTVQGYDLNYCGVIIGPELVFRNGRIVFLPENYKDRYGKHSSQTSTEITAYIINIYKTLFTRGIRGTFVYACDEGLRAYLSKFIESNVSESASIAAENEHHYGKD